MIAIIDYDAGNLKSVEKALAYLGEESVITRDFHTIEQADKVILPGVGSFGVAMDNLKRYELDKVIHEVCERKVPFLGICLGLQLMFEGSEESEGVEGLGLLEGKIVRIPDTYGLKIPHIGWNSLHLQNNGRLFQNVPMDAYNRNYRNGRFTFGRFSIRKYGLGCLWCLQMEKSIRQC